MRHHRICDRIKTKLVETGLEVHREVHCVAVDGSNRHADLVVIDRRNGRGLVLDPTVRFEIDADQAVVVDRENKNIYEACFADLGTKYNIGQWSCYGLLFGSIPAFTKEMLELWGIGSKEFLREVGLDIMRSSLAICHNHMYPPHC